MVWKVHKSIVWEHVLDEMYHAAYNLVKRLDHEWEENKEVRIVGAFSLQNSYWYILSVAQYQILFGTQMTSSVCLITFLNSRISCDFCSCTKSTMHGTYFLLFSSCQIPCAIQMTIPLAFSLSYLVEFPI